MNTPLNLYSINPIDELAFPEDDNEITIYSKALNIFTDFKNHKASVVDKEISATEAQILMQKSHVRMKIVVDENNAFLGIISLDDLTKQDMIRKITEGYSRDELSITDFYQEKEKLKAFDYDELSRSSVGDVINTLKTQQQQHCLVVDQQAHQIRGLISASDIARRLKIAIDLSAPSSFVGIFNALHP